MTILNHISMSYYGYVNIDIVICRGEWLWIIIKTKKTTLKQ